MLAYQLIIEIGRVFVPLDYGLNCLCILFDGAEEVLDTRLAPVGAIMGCDFWLGQNQARLKVGRRDSPL